MLDHHRNSKSSEVVQIGSPLKRRASGVLRDEFGSPPCDPMALNPARIGD